MGLSAAGRRDAGTRLGSVFSRGSTGLSGSVVAVTHIGVMRVLLARATGWNFEGSPPFKVKRDRLYRIDVHR